MSESSSEDTESPAPSRYPKVQQRPGDATPTLSSPPASPSLSFHSLGRSPFSPLRHQFSAHDIRSSQSPPSDYRGLLHGLPSLVDDSRDVLIQRLSDLTARLAAEEEVRGESVDTLHSKVDELEQILLHSTKNKPPRHRRNQSSLSINSEQGDSRSVTNRPPWLSRHVSEVALARPRTRDIGVQTATQTPSGHGLRDSNWVNPHHADHLLREAQKLHEALEMILNNLRARQEEQEHIHDLLITRAERAAQRIIYLEGRVNELENERNDGEMEVLNLQIQLKAIEVQCLSYVPKDADPDLLESIETWKTEWSALKRKRARQKGQQLAGPSSPSPRGFRRQVHRSQTAGL